jgi:hypothetical protein
MAVRPRLWHQMMYRLLFFEDNCWVSAFCTGQVFVDGYRPQVKVSSRLFNTSLNASLLLDLAVKYENRIEIKSDVMRDAEISHRHVANQNRESVVASEDEMLIESNMKM